ncbi:zona pellucida sperm-binding protein 4-like isoform X2 [Sceloporus undulatus]|uniref:zona pellucida sperm-binding protein 4-like isoform X2 n=1 Tax=Sceloporus undulatus TaxID=8520 RepID=UPI001C4AB8FF|nr:zona pellucida sperm-binding protein 4-like isoform X2 [Sceloporus undulatus]
MSTMFSLHSVATLLVVLSSYGILTVAVKRRDSGNWGMHQNQTLFFWTLDPPSLSLCSAIPPSDRLPCSAGSPRPVSSTECAELGCCYNPRDRLAPCFYAHKVTVRCTPDGMFSIAVSKNTTHPPLSLDSVRLLSSQGAACGPVAKNNMFVVFQFPLSACGTTAKETGSEQVYENELLAVQQVLTSRLGSITRDSAFRLTIRCSYSAEESLPASVLVAPPPPLAPVAQQGPLALEMRIARDESYSSYFTDADYPVMKVLRDPVHVEVRLLGRRDPVLVLLLHECWATPSTNPLQKPEWPLLEAGCPYKGDNYQTQLMPIGVDSGLAFPSHYQRFVISTFTFVDSASQTKLTGPVYFHCSVSACAPSRLEACSIRCEVPTLPRGRRQRGVARRHRPALQKLQTLVTSEGAVDFLSDAVEVSYSERSRPLLEGGLRWDGALSLVVGIVTVLSVATMTAVALKRHWGIGPEGGQAPSST